ncbi:hypothetical protein Hanom_Chr00s131332g01815471 [Helianthus anomalus]
MRSHPSNPIGRRVISLTLYIEADEHIDAAGTAPYGHFRHDKGCRQQSERATMRLAPHLAYFLITSKRRGNIRSYCRQRCGSHRILCAQQVGLTPQCK